MDLSAVEENFFYNWPLCPQVSCLQIQPWSNTFMRKICLWSDMYRHIPLSIFPKSCGLTAICTALIDCVVVTSHPEIPENLQECVCRFYEDTMIPLQMDLRSVVDTTG